MDTTNMQTNGQMDVHIEILPLLQNIVPLGAAAQRFPLQNDKNHMSDSWTRVSLTVIGLVYSRQGSPLSFLLTFGLMNSSLRPVPSRNSISI